MALSTIELKLPVPAIQGYFGDRLASYATQATAQSIVALLGHDPRSKNWKQLLPEVREIYEFLQRKTAKNRRDSLTGYMEDRFAPDAITIGAFPAISIGFIRPLDFEQSSDSGVGTLKIDLSPSTARVMLDGLGRVTAALDLLDEGRTEILDNMVFPVTIFAPKPGQKPLSYKELGQLFHDMNFKVQPVSKSHAVALDTSDLYITFASRIGEAAVISENGGVAERAASLGKKSTELVVQTVLVRFVRGALEGRAFQESNMATTENPNLTRETFAVEMEKIEGFLAAFADEMGSAFADRDSLHLTSPGWQALGVFYNDLAHRLNLESDQMEEFARAAGRLDWSRYNSDWIPMLGQAEIDKFTGADVVDQAGRKRVSIAGAGRSNVQNILDYVRRKTGVTDHLEVSSEEA
ncbi:MAG: DNA sulfur modification protein DndB [Sphingomonas sp.]|nr:DNA sulfur modification protein DndB [Sphingomonas sp.]